MNAPQKDFIDSDTKQKMLTVLQMQRDAHIEEGHVSAQTRIDRIDRAIEMLVSHAGAISDAMNEDFGCRPRETNLMTDVTGSLENLKHGKKHLSKWMKAENARPYFRSICWAGVPPLNISPKVWSGLSRHGTSRWHGV